MTQQQHTGSYQKHPTAPHTEHWEAEQCYLQAYHTAYTEAKINDHGTQIAQRIGSGNRCDTNTSQLGQYLSIAPPYQPLRLQTWQLNNQQLIIPQKADHQTVATGSMQTVDHQIKNQGKQGKQPMDRNPPPAEIIDKRSCLYSTQLTQGCLLLIAAFPTPQQAILGENAPDPDAGRVWASLLELPNPNQINEITEEEWTDLLFLNYVYQGKSLTYWGVVAISALYTEENQIEGTLKVVFEQLHQQGLEVTNFTQYYSYGIGKSQQMSLGIDSYGHWGEVFDEL